MRRCPQSLNWARSYVYGPVLNPPVLEVTIDIKPGDLSTGIKPKSTGKIPVAILTTPTFDATMVDPTTVRFGPTGIEAAPSQSALKDVNGDASVDLIQQFDIRETAIACGQSSAVLTGSTYSGQRIQGFERIVTVGCK